MKRLKLIPVMMMLGVLMGGIIACTVTVNDSLAVDDKDVSDYSKEVSKDAEKNTVDTNLMGTLEDTDNSGCGVYTTINLIITIITYGVAIAATVGLVITAIIYVTAGDNVERLTTAKTRAKEIVIGLGIYAVMWGAAQWLVPGGIMNDGEICKEATNTEVEDDTEEQEPTEETENAEPAEEVAVEDEDEEDAATSGKKGAGNGSGGEREEIHEKTFRERKILIEGDSIQTATFGSFLTQMAKNMGAESVDNHAERGATLAYNEEGKVKKNSVYYRISKMSDEELMKYDFIIISAGTNDWLSSWSKISSGLVTYDVGSERKQYYRLGGDPATTAGAAYQIKERIMKINSKSRKEKTRSRPIKLIFFSPIYRYKKNGSTNPTKKDKGDCDKIENTYGETLKDYREGIRISVAGCCYISGEDISTKKEASSKKYLKDWLHPTKAYAKTLAKRAQEKVESTCSF